MKDKLISMRVGFGKNTIPWVFCPPCDLEISRDFTSNFFIARGIQKVIYPKIEFMSFLKEVYPPTTKIAINYLL